MHGETSVGMTQKSMLLGCACGITFNVNITSYYQSGEETELTSLGPVAWQMFSESHPVSRCEAGNE